MIMTRLRCRGLVLCLWVAVGGFTAACTGESGLTSGPAAGPGSQGGNVIAPSFTLGAGGQEAYTLTATNSNDSIKIVLDTFPHPTLIKVTQSGTESEYWTAATNPNYAGQLKAVYDARGGWYGGTCYAGVELWYGSTTVGFCNYPGPSYAPPAEKWKIVQGAGQLWWNQRGFSVQSGGNEICGRVSGTPCYQYSGSFEITIERPEVEFKVSVTPSAKKQGTSTQAVFKAEMTPAQLGGVAVPFKINSWIWVPDSGSSVIACLAPPQGTNPATCGYTPASSGSMHCNALVNGEEQTKTAHFSVLPCLTGDSLLDDARIRRALKAALDGSNPNGPPHQRVERFGGRFLRPDGTILDTVFQAPAGAGPCTTGNWPNTSGIGTPLVTWHTHPFRPRSSSDTLPRSTVVCPGNPNPYVPRRLAPGPSTCDPAIGGSCDFTVNAGVPIIVVDKDNVYVVGPYDPADRRTFKWKTYKRSACDALSY